MRKFGICTAAFIILILAAGFWARSGYTQIDWNNDEELSDFTVLCCNSGDFVIISDNNSAEENLSGSTDSDDAVADIDSDGNPYVEITVPATESNDSSMGTEYSDIDSDGQEYIEIAVPANNDEDGEDETGTDTEDLRKELEDALRDADYVLKVSCDGNTEVSFGMTIQDVTVLETYTGLQSLDGKSIHLVSSSEEICFGELWGNELSIGGYTNFMEEGEDYLLFCDDIGSKNMYREVSALSYFALSDLDNIIPESDETAYELLKNNEFFAADQEALDILLDIKENMLDLYLQ